MIGSLVALLLAIVGEATTSRRDAPAAALGILATSALALSLPDARVAVLAATAGGGFGALVALAPTAAAWRDDRDARPAGHRGRGHDGHRGHRLDRT